MPPGVATFGSTSLCCVPRCVPQVPSVWVGDDGTQLLSRIKADVEDLDPALFDELAEVSLRGRGTAYFEPC